MQRFLNHTATAIILPALIGLGGAALSTLNFGQYGWSLFLLLPIIVSFLSAFAYSFRRPITFEKAYGISSLSILTLGFLIILLALDGLICLLMALPLALGMGVIGTALGKWASISLSGKGGASCVLLLCFCFPFLVAFEDAKAPDPVIRKVTTQVWINAPITTVWDTVIAFPEITDAPSGIFKLGIAYPVRAHIDGKGVGAIRRCTFSTGDFVEPITAWNAPHLLAFDVTENPSPMREISIYPDVHAPHLHGFMVSKRGQFRLTEKDGGVLLEGTTWYAHDLSPEAYWGAISDSIIHAIHRRVLEHIKLHAETGN